MRSREAGGGEEKAVVWNVSKYGTSVSESFQQKGVVGSAALPLTLPAAVHNYPGIEATDQQTFWLFSWKLLPRKMPLHLRDTGTSLAEGPAELP